MGTIVHHPEDARIMHRQIRALLAAGHDVTYVAPFTHCNVTPSPKIRAVDVPRAVGLRRAKAIRAARGALRRAAADADLIVVHDVELLLALPRGRRVPPVVWDVHGDTAAALAAREHLAPMLRSVLVPLVRRLEARAERRVRLIVAEEACLTRFRAPHPVVRNMPDVPETPPPPPGEDRVVHVGHLATERGAAELIELARLLRPHGIRMDLIGGADTAIRPRLRDAQREGVLDWYGHVPSRYALRMVEGALAGLSLLRDLPHHRTAEPTKLIEYMSRGVPVISTPLPPAVSLIDEVRCGRVVPFGDPEAAARAVLRLREDLQERIEMGERGYREARRHHWPDHAPAFVALLESWAGAGATARRALAA
ncbi:Glycosyltransferase involved in cell wall bisynthesis [Thermostaphylospora chromogena]|uniref:Glycosyltransferase involved in cell wall bisynthesis n=2 Tax=Thermostaphylospora chromogena TaxID=35622 RepID=A0A1H1EIE7_9ACTN|nr:Glycosyltransferase involved in cell wall bisynthesis [Thermostaphylospora chromogena]